MNYELAKQLKDAGFPFRTSLFASINDNTPLDFNGTPYNVPTLSELIEACGKYVLVGEIDKEWIAFYSEDGFKSPVGLDAIDTFLVRSEHGTTPEEAVANLYLALHAKKRS